LSRYGRIVMQYGMGELASDYSGVRATDSWVHGSRVRYIRGKKLATLLFPDNGCANFFIVAQTKADLDLIETFRASFQPHNHLPAWLLQRLPELARLECRYGSLVDL
jgi:hypothetical protein